MLVLLAGLFASVCVDSCSHCLCYKDSAPCCIRGDFIFAVRLNIFHGLGFPRLGSGFVDWTRVQPNCSIQLYCAMLSIRI